MSFNDTVAVLFDLDGTLTDYDAGCEAGLKAALKIMNAEKERPLSFDIFKEAYEAVIEAEAHWSSNHGFKLPALENRVRRFRILFDSIGFTPGPILKEMAEAYGVGRATGTQVFPDTRETLDYLVDKYRLGVITEGSVETQTQQLEGQKIAGYFDAVIISGATPWHKPDINLYELAVSKLKTNPEHIVMVGDRLDWDIKPAKAVGMTTVYYNHDEAKPGDETALEYVDKEIFRLSDLRSVL